MEFKTNVYQIGAGQFPNNVDTELHKDYDSLAEILGLDHYLETPNEGDYLEELPEHPVPQKLNKELLNKLSEFSSEILEKSLPECNYSSHENNLLHFLRLRRLLSEQIEYTYSDGQDCDVYFIISSVNNHNYGGIFLFHGFDGKEGEKMEIENEGNIGEMKRKQWNREGQREEVVIQGISKFLIPSLFSFLYPEEEKYLPRLNTLLQSAVESLCMKLKVKRIYVAPVGKQGKILQEHYGYKKVDKIPFPSRMIRGSSVERKDILMLCKEI